MEVVVTLCVIGRRLRPSTVMLRLVTAVWVEGLSPLSIGLHASSVCSFRPECARSAFVGRACVHDHGGL
jgi:hypothetical protein